VSERAPSAPLFAQPDALAALAAPSTGGPASPFGLSAEETLVLQSVGWEPVGLCYGAAMASVPLGFEESSGEPVRIAEAVAEAYQSATWSCEQRCKELSAEGALGIALTLSIDRHVVTVRLFGSAIARINKRSRAARPFLATLSGQDFALLQRANWVPVGLALGVAYAGIPARPAGDAVRQRLSGAELETASAALGFARELAIARAERAMAGRHGQGIVALEIGERRARVSGMAHVVELRVSGTVIRALPGGHRPLGVRAVLGLDDRVRAFAAEALRGKSEP